MLLFLCGILSPTMAQDKSSTDSLGKERKFYLYGHVYDSFTKVAIEPKITLMRTDSTLVDTTSAHAYDRESYFNFAVPRRNASYIIKAVCQGYEDAYANYDVRVVARNNASEVPPILMRKKADDDIFREDSLGGVVVTGTKIRMVTRGDTIIYNAEAFKLPDGSMLDNLIRQLPGAELKGNGDIYINGKKLDYLTLNGKDFFKGNNKVMLENLPYYIVKDLRVYNKQTELSQYRGKDVEKRDFVMDVTLKREYNRGLITNAELAGGTKHRYMGRVFGLYYDDHTRIALFGNMNNVNENRSPNGNGDWSPSNMPQGQTVTRQAGLNINTEDKGKHIEENAEVRAQWTDANNETRTSTEQFASAGNIFGRNTSMSRQKDFELSFYNSLKVKKPVWMNTFLNVVARNGNAWSNMRSATYDREPRGTISAVLDSAFSAPMASLINRSHNETWNRYRSLDASFNMNAQFNLPWGDYMSFGANANYHRTDPSDRISRTGTYYTQTGQTDFRNIYADSHAHGYSIGALANYSFNLNDWAPSLAYTYEQGFNSSNDLNHRLDQLGGRYGQATEGYDRHRTLRSYLPSTRDSLLLALDMRNSSRYNMLTRKHRINPSVTYNKDSYYFQLEFPINHTGEQLNYHGSGIDTLATRSFTRFMPRLTFFRWAEEEQISAHIELPNEPPSLISLMPVDNDLNPLARHINNPHLKNSSSVDVEFSYGRSFKNNTRIELQTSTSVEHNTLGSRTTYDSQTGAYTFMPDNVNGNWHTTETANYTAQLDSARHFTLTAEASLNYARSVDFDIAYDNRPAPLSHVNNFFTGAKLQLAYQAGDLNIRTGGNATWRNSTGDRQNFQVINAWDFDYGLNLGYKLPLAISLATELRMYSRRGYQEPSMNTNDLVWNAELSRSFCKGHLTASLQAFDMLHQLSSTTYSVNAQGRTEVWQNCIPSYAMLHLSYKFTMAPKKKAD